MILTTTITVRYDTANFSFSRVSHLMYTKYGMFTNMVFALFIFIARSIFLSTSSEQLKTSCIVISFIVWWCFHITHIVMSCDINTDHSDEELHRRSTWIVYEKLWMYITIKYSWWCTHRFPVLMVVWNYNRHSNICFHCLLFHYNNCLEIDWVQICWFDVAVHVQIIVLPTQMVMIKAYRIQMLVSYQAAALVIVSMISMVTMLIKSIIVEQWQTRLPQLKMSMSIVMIIIYKVPQLHQGVKIDD